MSGDFTAISRLELTRWQGPARPAVPLHSRLMFFSWAWSWTYDTCGVLSVRWEITRQEKVFLAAVCMSRRPGYTGPRRADNPRLTSPWRTAHIGLARAQPHVSFSIYDFSHWLQRCTTLARLWITKRKRLVLDPFLCGIWGCGFCICPYEHSH